MANDKRSFFERLTGTVNVDDEFEDEPMGGKKLSVTQNGKKGDVWAAEEESADGHLTVDVNQTPTHIVIRTMVAGVRPEDLDVSITRDMVTIRGKREEQQETSDDDYFLKELYWGSFSRTIMLPQEVEVDSAEAVERQGLLTIRIPKINKERQTKLKIRTN